VGDSRNASGRVGHHDHQGCHTRAAQWLSTTKATARLTWRQLIRSPTKRSWHVILDPKTKSAVASEFRSSAPRKHSSTRTILRACTVQKDRAESRPITRWRSRKSKSFVTSTEFSNGSFVVTSIPL